MLEGCTYGHIPPGVYQEGEREAYTHLSAPFLPAYRGFNGVLGRFSFQKQEKQGETGRIKLPNLPIIPYKPGGNSPEGPFGWFNL